MTVRISVYLQQIGLLVNFGLFRLSFINQLTYQTLMGMFAPFGTANIQLRIFYNFFTVIAGVKGIVFPEFYFKSTIRAPYIKNVFWFPKPLVLPGALYHNNDLLTCKYKLSFCFPLLKLTSLHSFLKSSSISLNTLNDAFYIRYS